MLILSLHFHLLFDLNASLILMLTVLNPPYPTGGDVAVFVFDINQPSLPTPLYSVLASVSVFITPSTVFHSITSHDNSPLSHSVLLVLFLPYWSFQLYIFL